MRTMVIKGFSRKDMWDCRSKKRLKDPIPVGFVMEVEGQIPESYVKYIPNRIFDRRKYPELYLMFGKDHLPTENEMECHIRKNYRNWCKSSTENIQNNRKLILTTALTSAIITALGMMLLGVI